MTTKQLWLNPKQQVLAFQTSKALQMQINVMRSSAAGKNTRDVYHLFSLKHPLSDFIHPLLTWITWRQKIQSRMYFLCLWVKKTLVRSHSNTYVYFNSSLKSKTTKQKQLMNSYCQWAKEHYHIIEVKRIVIRNNSYLYSAWLDTFGKVWLHFTLFKKLR